MSLVRSQLEILRRSAEALTGTEVAPYFKLKAGLAQRSAGNRAQFERDFARFYGLNIAGLTDDFRRAYFDALFSARPSAIGWPDYRGLLERFHAIPNRKGLPTLQASFVSKLVASRDESRPLYDVHVGNFFGLFVPGVGSLGFRAQVLVSHLEVIQQKYLVWAGSELAPALARLKERIPELAACDDVRVCDFLVWRAGNKKLTDAIQ